MATKKTSKGSASTSKDVVVIPGARKAASKPTATKRSAVKGAGSAGRGESTGKKVAKVAARAIKHPEKASDAEVAQLAASALTQVASVSEGDPGDEVERSESGGQGSTGAPVVAGGGAEGVEVETPVGDALTSDASAPAASRLPEFGGSRKRNPRGAGEIEPEPEPGEVDQSTQPPDDTSDLAAAVAQESAADAAAIEAEVAGWRTKFIREMHDQVRGEVTYHFPTEEEAIAHEAVARTAVGFNGRTYRVVRGGVHLTVGLG